MSITTLLAQRARERPGHPFVVTPQGEFSFSDIHAAAGRFAALLAQHGVGKGDHVALLAGNGAGFLVAWFGINLRGGVAVTLNTQLIGDGLRYSVAQCEAKLLVVDREWHDSRHQQLDARQRSLPLVLIEDDRAFMASLDALVAPAPAAVQPQEPATIMYTSGTTGLPKGVVNCHAAYLATGVATARALGITGSDRIMVFLPLFHTNPQMYAVMSALTTGATLILLPHFSAGSFFDDAVRYRATGFTFVGTVLSILVARHAGEQRAHTLRFCFGGGSPTAVWEAVEQRFGVRVHEAYGMTETGGWSSANTVAESRFGSCGRPRADLDIRIVGPDDQPLPAGDKGEIVVRPQQPHVMLMGYWRQPEQMLAACRNLWFHTGDLGSFDEDGFLYYHGRIKELIRRNGEMISPAEIETTLRRLPGLADCAVVAVPDAIAGDEIKAVIVSDQPLQPAQVQAFLAERLAPFLLPRYIEFSAAIPKTETEKIQRSKLQYLDARVHDLKTGRACVAANAPPQTTNQDETKRPHHA
jgi:acyl-CoA synthetase (AMP-forming)/AMP-acid ligase II